MPTAAPKGDLGTFESSPFTAKGATHDVYRKGGGPAVIVITEMPGLSPMVLGFADRLVAMGFSVALPDLYGTPGRDPMVGSKLSTNLYVAKSMLSGCISRDFSTFALDRTSPIAAWLRALARAEHERCGGAGVGVIGMCFSGGFALAMATDPSVVAPVMSQPSLPLPVGNKRKAAIDVSNADLDVIAGRCAKEGLRVLGLRFEDDPYVSAQRFAFLHDRLGDGFTSIELDQADGHPNSPTPKHHSVLTGSLIDEPDQPTRKALDDVLTFFRERLSAAEG